MFDDNWRHISEALESALMDALSGRGAYAERLLNPPPGPRSVGGATDRTGMGNGKRTPAETGASFQGLRREGETRPSCVLLANRVQTNRCERIASAPTRLPLPRAMRSHLVVLRRESHACSRCFVVTGAGVLRYCMK